MKGIDQWTNGGTICPCSGAELKSMTLNKAEELDDLLQDIRALIVPFVAKATQKASPSKGVESDYCSRLIQGGEQPPQELNRLLGLNLPEDGAGKTGVLDLVSQILRYSVNTWDEGFMHKLYGSTNAVGVVSELVLGVLNGNLHVYQVSPALTTIERTTARTLAGLFNLKGPYAGGVTQPGGSASNTTALIVARNELFPATKVNGYGDTNFVLFTSADSHYSLQKAAQICGFGLRNAWSVPVDVHGKMRVDELERMILQARREALTPLFVNATAGTTVRGAFDPLADIAQVCRREGLWFHVDASWGGSTIFSTKHQHKIIGCELADSLTINPHKMMGVPVTCSFLLTSDLRRFHRANTLPAGYLFHDDLPVGGEQKDESEDMTGDPSSEFWDLADLTLQCGRKGDSLKLALGWIYYGRAGYGAQIDTAFEVTAHLASLVSAEEDLVLVGENPPPCLQVCFYYAKGGQYALDAQEKENNTQRTKQISRALVKEGFMVDYAPGEMGSFLRPVVHLMTTRMSVERLVKAVLQIGACLE